MTNKVMTIRISEYGGEDINESPYVLVTDTTGARITGGDQARWKIEMSQDLVNGPMLNIHIEARLA